MDMENIDPNNNARSRPISIFNNINTIKTSNNVCKSLTPSSSLIEDHRIIIVRVLQFNINSIKNFKLPIVIELCKQDRQRKVIELYSFKNVTPLGNTLVFSLLETESNNVSLFQVNYNDNNNDNNNDEIKIGLKINKANDKLGNNSFEMIEGKILKINGVQRIKLYCNRHAVGEMLVDSSYQIIGDDDDDNVSEAPLTPLTPIPTLLISSNIKITPIPTSIEIKQEVRQLPDQYKQKRVLGSLLMLFSIVFILMRRGIESNNKTRLFLTSSTFVDVIDENGLKFSWVHLFWNMGYTEFSKERRHQWRFEPKQNNSFQIKHKDKCLSKMLKLKSCDKTSEWHFSENLLCVDSFCLSKVNKKIKMNEEESNRILISLVNNEKKYNSVNVKT